MRGRLMPQLAMVGCWTGVLGGATGDVRPRSGTGALGRPTDMEGAREAGVRKAASGGTGGTSWPAKATQLVRSGFSTA